MHRAAIVLVIGLVVLLPSGVWFTGPGKLPDRAVVTPNQIQKEADPGWTDNFTNNTYVGASSGVAIAGHAVTLAPSSLAREGLVLPLGAAGSFESNEVAKPTVLLEQGVYRMWYYGSSSSGTAIGYATSPDGHTWTKQGMVLSPTLPQEGSFVDYPEVARAGSQLLMWYCGFDGTYYRIFAARGVDGMNWTKEGVVVDVGSSGSPDDEFVSVHTVAIVNGTYYMWYVGTSFAAPTGQVIMLAVSTNGLNWTKEGVVLQATPGALDDGRVLDPSVRYYDGRFEMVYAGTNSTNGTQRLFFAQSQDGMVWLKRGLALNIAAPLESPTLSMPGILRVSAHDWYVYYSARGTSFQIFLANLTRLGYLRSRPIYLPSNGRWVSFSASGAVSNETNVLISVLDGQTLLPLAGMQNLTARAIDLSSIDPSAHPSLALEAWLGGGFLSTPVLSSWSVSWTVPQPSQGPAAPQELNLAALIPWILAGVLVIAAVAWVALVLSKSRRRERPPL